MLEARLLVNLAHAQSLHMLGYTNDAEDAIGGAVMMAVDTKWEDELATILIMPGMRNYEDIKTEVLSRHQGVTEENIYDMDAHFCDKHTRATNELRRLCREDDKQYNEYVSDQLSQFIESLTNAISDKIHRRNLQIADLKRELDNRNKAVGDASMALLGCYKELQSLEYDMTKAETNLLTRLLPKVSRALAIM
jgi:hypothetical protein